MSASHSNNILPTSFRYKDNGRADGASVHKGGSAAERPNQDTAALVSSGCSNLLPDCD